MHLRNMMIALCCLLLAGAGKIQAQVDVKINPIGVLFNSPDLSVEYVFNESFGVEGRLGFNYGRAAFLSLSDSTDVEIRRSGVKGLLGFRYYVRPKADKPGTGFYPGVYLKAASNKWFDKNAPEDKVGNTRIAAGIMLGYKWVTQHNVVIDLSGGFGRAFLNKFEAGGVSEDVSSLPLVNMDGMLNFSVGYRFGYSSAE